jgi:hypothetical protein
MCHRCVEPRTVNDVLRLTTYWVSGTRESRKAGAKQVMVVALMGHFSIATALTMRIWGKRKWRGWSKAEENQRIGSRVVRFPFLTPS